MTSVSQPPAIPIQNIYYLLCYAWDKLEERDWVQVNTQEPATVLELLVRVLINGTTYLLKRGIAHNYRLHDEWTAGVRGKMNTSDTLRSIRRQTGHTKCTFDEFSPNITVNQILKTTLSNASRLHGLAPEMTRWLVRLADKMSGITTIPLSEELFEGLRSKRPTSLYVFLLNICELLHRNALVEEKTGTYYFRDFWREPSQMAILFEAFVRNFYRRELPQAQVYREDIRWQVEATEQARRLLPKMQTDVSININNRCLVIDTKYYTQTLQLHYNTEKLHSSHLYQLYSYLKNHPTAQEGILVYPVVEREISEVYEQAGQKIRVETLNLAQPWEQIAARLESIVLNAK